MTKINFKNFENPYLVNDNTIFYEGADNKDKHHIVIWLDETIGSENYSYYYYRGVNAIKIYCEDDETFLILATTIELLK